jgi:hypothetical protein
MVVQYDGQLINSLLDFFSNKSLSQALMANSCNPNYSGSRDQKDHSSTSTQANNPRDTISKKLNTKKQGWQSGSSGRAAA